MIRLENTDARQINETLFRLRKEGQAASGQVLTLVVDTVADEYEDAMREAQEAGQLHPSRILLAIRGMPGGDVLNAVVHQASTSTEVIAIELGGDIDQHAESVLLPLLLPELPVVIWWPKRCPDQPWDCDFRGLSSRLIVDSMALPDSLDRVHRLAANHHPGITDLSWTRLTKWRAMLLASLDHTRSPVTSAAVAGPATASRELIGAWLEMQLGVPVSYAPAHDEANPGLHSVQLFTVAGEIRLERVSPIDAVLVLPDQPVRPVALARRTIQDMLTEELLRLTGDEAFDALMGYLTRRGKRPNPDDGTSQS